MHVYTNTHNLIKHTHTSLCRFLLQLFMSPWHFEACSCLPVSLPPNSSFSFTPLLLHFMRFCFPSSSLPVCLLLPSLSAQSVFGVSYQMFHHVTLNKVKCSTLFFLHLFFLLCSCCITRAAFFIFFFTSCVSSMQPHCNT